MKFFKNLFNISMNKKNIYREFEDEFITDEYIMQNKEQYERIEKRGKYVNKIIDGIGMTLTGIICVITIISFIIIL